MALFKAGRGNYDIQILKDDRWVTEAMRNWEGDAKELAEKLLENKKIAGVRVVLEDASGGGFADQVIFEQKQDIAKEKPVRITPVEKVQVFCGAPRDFFGFEARLLMNIMFRDYLELMHLTPTEILHSERELKRLSEKDNLLSAAVDNVARLQIKQTGQSLRDRRQELFDVFDLLVDQSSRAEQRKLPELSGTFSDLIKRVSKVKDETPEYLAMTVLCKELSGKRNWIAKLDRLLQLAAMEEAGSKPLLLLDTVVADVLGANVLQELLGWQASLGSAIIAMIDLAEGKFEADDDQVGSATLALGEQLGEGRLPAAQNVLIDRAIRQLRSPNPLYRSEPNKEMEEYQRIMARLLVPGGILSGAKAAEAMTLRGARFVEQGGATGKRTAISATVKALPDPARGVMYLAELSNTDVGEDHIDHIVGQMDDVFGARVIDELCRRSMSPKDRLMTATGAFTAAKSSALPPDLRDRIADHIDGVLERYLVDESIIDKLDNPEAHLRDRAVRLVKFCGAGVLPEGRALQKARKRIVEILRQPNFESKFVDDIEDPEVAERVLRDFHKMLKQAGLS